MVKKENYVHEISSRNNNTLSIHKSSAVIFVYYLSLVSFIWKHLSKTTWFTFAWKCLWDSVKYKSFSWLIAFLFSHWSWHLMPLLVFMYSNVSIALVPWQNAFPLKWQAYDIIQLVTIPIIFCYLKAFSNLMFFQQTHDQHFKTWRIFL